MKNIIVNFILRILSRKKDFLYMWVKCVDCKNYFIIQTLQELSEAEKKFFNLCDKCDNEIMGKIEEKINGNRKNETYE